jgi:aflatoxin B1 aldehyde reductase
VNGSSQQRSNNAIKRLTLLSLLSFSLLPNSSPFYHKDQNYLPRFYTASNFAALSKIRLSCEAAGLTMVEATYLWMLLHSSLQSTDGLLIGASSMPQLTDNLSACTKAAKGSTLPPQVLTAFDEAFDVVKQEDIFAYWRSYSADMPRRETLDPGAAYSAAKK